MFKSIFTKLLVTYLVIIIAIITTLSLVLTMIYSRHVFSEKNKSLISAAFKVNQLADALNRKQISKQELDNSLDSMGYITDSKIYIVRMDKQSLASSKTLKIGEEMSDDYLIDDLKRVMDGQTVFHQKQYTKGFDMYMVFTGVPWKTEGRITGAILLFSPVDHITSDITKINLVIGVIALIFILLSAFIIYINSLRISRPIKEMEQAAVKLAVGENTEDISVKSQDEIGKLAATFNFMKQKLIDTEKMRREFIANVSHDLRTPLTSINGFVEGMLDGIVKHEDYNKYLHIIQEETNRLTRLTNEILQLAKIQSGSLNLSKKVMSVAEVVRSVMDSINILLEEKSITPIVECDADLQVYADEDRLRQILINIAGNSVKYSNRGGSISIKVVDVPLGIRFAVKDTGIGVSADELPFIFEKFYQVDKSRQSPHGGTGLGLNIVKSLIEMHGGRIWAESEIGIGTEIFFELPKI